MLLLFKLRSDFLVFDLLLITTDSVDKW